ncbi:PQQ-binding-like beta-propeller repeat protein [Fuerstiella marisgermanici]|uniref:Serine/threonine-protein kinase AfsK n=1 Tax=Fuerstiella marisgermanici TaxID=1891926 RepID=A0A1P8WCY5_9PLAN|nr:PQQ-binding-like beta-propeller repeat protein [Fuerstiella marisgermanici]APZ91926.1 Serine/threonine-protein kinase AfsK [Fuerstiella marisgermanici]
MNPSFLLRVVSGIGLLVCSVNTASADDWPTYRGDNARAGGSHESLPLPLNASWTYTSPAPPEMAWSSGEGKVYEGKVLGHRVKFDDVFHPVAVDGKLYFGSTADDQLHCMDLKTGKTEWTFFTGAPVRLAPSVANGKVYFGSDDGRVYCVDAATGKQLWQFRAGAEDDWLLARGEMISRWPVRTGVLVDDGVAFFGAGIFPHEYVYLYAVDANDGSVIWKQDNLSSEDAGRNDLSPQGYLLASKDLLIVPSGRTLPAAFDRKTGKLVHKRTHSWRTTAGGIIGGTKALLADGQIYSGGPHHLLAMNQKNGDAGYGWFAGRQMVVLDDAAYVATGTVVAKLNRGEYAVNSRIRHDLEMKLYGLSRSLRGQKDKKKVADIRKQISDANDAIKEIADVGVAWQKETVADAALLATPEAVFVGGTNKVTAYSAADGEIVWTAKVNGKARGLAVADERLIVSTDSGSIHVFGGDEISEPDTSLAAFAVASEYHTAAEQILKQTGIRRGFCLVIDGNEGELAYEIASQSDLEVYMIEPDAKKAATARKRLADAGVYGSRVTVHNFDVADIPYSNYFANLIVSDEFVKTGKLKTDPTLIARHLKPAGGVMCLGQPDGDSATAAAALKTVEAEFAKDKDSVAADAEADDEAAKTVANSATKTEGGFATLTRAILPGAGSWSHQYGNAANTAVSDEKRVTGGLGVLWYGDPGIGEMVNRHDGAVGPLAVGGRLIVQGQTTIRAYDAYNGLFLWNYDNPKGIRLGVYKGVSPGNLAATEDRLFHFIGPKCFELDAATGETLRVHDLPESRANGKHQWGYIAVKDNLLFGTATVMESIDAIERRRGRKTKDATDGIFAIDLTTGKHLWDYQGQSISHRTIAIGPDKVFFIDSTITSDQRAEILRQDKSELQNLTGKAREIAEDRMKKIDLRRAVALDSRTGEKVWAKPVDVTDCSEIGIGGGMLTLMYQNDTLILGGANANGHYWRQFVAGEFSRRRLVALSAADGYKLWAKDANYRHRPIIVGNRVLAEPWIYDLHSGEQQMRQHPITGEDVPWSMMRTGHHCGMLTGADSGMIMFRSGATGFMDLEQDAGIRHFAGHRLGCWINAIPANGLVMIPEASAGCVCLFSIASTIVMEPREARTPWAIYSSVGTKTPVRHLALNLGAPGDRKDAHGTVWLSYPRYKAYQETSLDVKLDLQPKFGSGGGYEAVNENALTVNSEQPEWLYTSWAQGLEKLTLPLLGKDDKPAKFKVQLHFANVRSKDPGATFDVQFNGETVLKDVTLPAAGEGESAGTMSEVKDVAVKDNLTITLVAANGQPLLNAVKVLRQE